MIGNSDFLMGGAADSNQFASEFQQLETPEGELHLRFSLTSGKELALPAVGIKEVFDPSPDEITPMPNVSPLLLGTFNVRGRVVWVADLGQFLGEVKPLNTDRTQLFVIAVEDQDTILGLAVDHIVKMQWLDIEQLQMSTNAPDGMAPFLRGEWVFQEQDQVIALSLLDQVSVLRSARWAA
jgi:twitching motility protein PilI